MRLQDLPRAILPVALLSSAIGLAACASAGTSAVEQSAPVRMLPPDAAPAEPVDNMPAGFRPAFARADARARRLVFAQECAAMVTRLRASGTFGAAAAAPKAIYCTRTVDGVPVGGVYDVDSAFTRPRRLTLIRLDGARPRFTEAVDTAAIAGEARMVRDITREVGPGWRAIKRAFVVVPIVSDSGVAEGWVLTQAPRPRTAVLGGDVAFVRNGEGRLVRIVDHLGTYALAPIPAAGPVRLVSAEAEVPAVADLVAARGLADIGREVSVRTALAISQLVPRVDPATGARFSWEHSRTPR